MLPLFFNPGYIAPLTVAVYAIFVKTLRRIRPWMVGGNSTGLAFSRYLMLACLVLVLLRAAAEPLHLQLYGPRTWFSLDFQLTERSRIQAQLSQSSGTDLVIVQYPGTNPGKLAEWVFNDADIDSSKVVWARDLGADKNLELTEYFNYRRAWILKPDISLPILERYSGKSAVGENAGKMAAQAGSMER